MKITNPFGLVFAALGLFFFFGLGLMRSLLPMSMWKKAEAEIDEVKAQEKTRSVYYYVGFRDNHGIEHRVMTLVIMGFALVMTFIGLNLSGLWG